MPVFYLVAALAIVVAGAGFWNRHTGTAPKPVGPASTESVTAPAATARPTKTAPVPSDDGGILRTRDGLRRKVLVKDLGLVCRSDPDGGVVVGPPLDYFAIRYLYGEEPRPRPRMFLIGPREGPPQGWVPAQSVLEWDTRLMARPTPRAGRPALVIYKERACLLDHLAGRTCARHGAACPTEGEEAPSARDSAPSAAGLPILSSEEIPQPNGRSRAIFEVASLVHDAARPPEPQAPPADALPALRYVYVAFAIDTTRSMQASIEAVRAMAAALVTDAAHRYKDMTLRLALVEYRDADPAYGFRARIVTPFTDAARFREAIRNVRVSKHADGSVDESVFDGLAKALPAPAGEPLGKVEHLDWPRGRAGELASKMVILLGDAPDHARDLARAGALAELARRAGITIATIRIDATRSPNDEEPRYRAQWRALAERSFRPLDRRTGFRDKSAPLDLPLGQAASIAPALQALIGDRIEHARELAGLAAAEAENRLADYVNSQGLTLQQVHPVLVDLHSREPSPVARPDPRFQGRKAPSLRRGWIAERIDGKPLVTVEMLMSRTELDDLIRELTGLQEATQGTARDLADLLRIGTAAAAGETAFLASDRGDQTFADHVRRRQGLPPPRPDSLLGRTQGDLLQADELYRSALGERLSSAIRKLVHRRNEVVWNDPRQTIEGMALVPYEWIDF